ncbi:MAG: sugar transferase, partial [Bacillota bacterium]|nr:sugar transferase [Bacillota bacterium]
TMGGPNEDVEYLIIKRLFDFVLSLIAIIALSWLMIIIALIIRLSDGGPAIYKQVRLTKNGKKFNIYKFRSMKVDAEKDGVARLATEDDDRITPIGKFIRKCRLDELPQLFNILKGDMTIVGPRPERPEIAKQYEESIPAFKLRLQVKAGLTGYSQVYGRYSMDPYDKLEMDLMYINKRDFFTDLAIIFATVVILFSSESAAGVDASEITAIENGDEDFA